MRLGEIPLKHAYSPHMQSLRYQTNQSTSIRLIHPCPTNLNQFGLQSSRFSHCSPSVKRPVTQPLHLGELGQLKNGICWYPISRNLDKKVSLANFKKAEVTMHTNEFCFYPQKDPKL
jgi:hypothetical protein